MKEEDEIDRVAKICRFIESGIEEDRRKAVQMGTPFRQGNYTGRHEEARAALDNIYKLFPELAK